jgi:hypothetical protein
VTPPGFEIIRDRSTALLLRADLRDWLLPLLRGWGNSWAGYETRALATGRGGTRLVRATGHDVVVRLYRRGGLVAWVLHDTYFGWRPRPFRELETLVTLQQHGASVVEVYGAAVHWLLPGCYRGCLVTRYLAGSSTLWEWVAGAPPPAVRARVFAQVGRAIRRLHDLGGQHPDLNLNNILIGPTQAGADVSDACDVEPVAPESSLAAAAHSDPALSRAPSREGSGRSEPMAPGPAAPAVVFIDFDRPHGVSCLRRAPQAELTRLERSARKLDPEGAWVTAADLVNLRAAYATSTACA